MKYFRGGLIALALIFMLVPVPSKANNNHYYYAGKYKKGELSVKVYKNSQKKALKKVKNVATYKFVEKIGGIVMFSICINCRAIHF